MTSTMSTIKLCGLTGLLGIFLETNKHQNLTRLSRPIIREASAVFIESPLIAIISLLFQLSIKESRSKSPLVLLNYETVSKTLIGRKECNQCLSARTFKPSLCFHPSPSVPSLLSHAINNLIPFILCLFISESQLRGKSVNHPQSHFGKSHC